MTYAMSDAVTEERGAAMTNQTNKPEEHAKTAPPAPEPRDLNPKSDSDGLTRLIANDDADNPNPTVVNKNIEESDADEKHVESGVEEAKEKAETEYSLTPHSI
jgi:hypothetical protein